MDILIVVLSSLALVGVIVCLVLILINSKKKPISPNSIEAKDLWELSSKINNLEKDLSNSISRQLLNEINTIKDENFKINEAQNSKLERFQTSITLSLQERFDSVNNQIDQKLSEISKRVDEKLQDGFKGTNETFAQVRERLQAIDDAQKNMENLGKDVVSLKNVLEGNQSRGRYGELQLSIVLHNVFGDTIGAYEEQYTLKEARDGEVTRADAIVFLPEPNKMLAIDSKFPFKNFERLFDLPEGEEKESLKRSFASDVKKHITDIKNKYIIDGKTSPYAIMFIPNDGVFAFIHQNLEDCIEFARQKNVIITSPSTLPAILLTVNMVRIQSERAKNLKIISDSLAKLGNEFGKFGEEWTKFSNQLATATNTREKLDSRVLRIQGKFSSIQNSQEIGVSETEEE